ncbi:hypothetical protein Ciccas_011401 [Cichlidogyrus casuarinus]|uniref:Uncharacterized protein n=1 Tax=Cichlidogyrus casuarinus TaxID=1844966 RepID=A0ABD2PRE2_9PLAT
MASPHMSQSGMNFMGAAKQQHHMQPLGANANDVAVCSVPPLESHLDSTQASSTVVSSVSSTQGLYNEIPHNGNQQLSPRGKLDHTSPSTIVALTLPDSGVYDSVVDAPPDDAQLQKHQSIYYNYSLIDPDHSNR